MIAKKIKVRFSENSNTFKAELKENKNVVRAKFGEGQTVTEFIGGDPYEGEYAVTPKTTQQILPTKHKVMSDDMTIKAIPYFDVSNNSGGSTVYIGREVI